MADSDRIYPTKKVTLYRGDKIVGVYTKEAPLPEGSIISTDGRCAVKLDELYLSCPDVFAYDSDHDSLRTKEDYEKSTSWVGIRRR